MTSASASTTRHAAGRPPVSGEVVAAVVDSVVPVSVRVPSALCGPGAVAGVVVSVGCGWDRGGSIFCNTSITPMKTSPATSRLRRVSF